MHIKEPKELIKKPILIKKSSIKKKNYNNKINKFFKHFWVNKKTNNNKVNNFKHDNKNLILNFLFILNNN